MRKLKKQIREILTGSEFEKKLCSLPAKEIITPLISLFYNNDLLIRWRAITSIGTIVAELAESEMEAARVVVRRLIWNLTEEAGGIGWGSPEAIGEITAKHEQLAQEYHNILISYIVPAGNYLEFEPLQQGALWGIGRLAHARPHLVEEQIDFLLPYLGSPDPVIRGLAAWSAAIFPTAKNKRLIAQLANDQQLLPFYFNGICQTVTISQLVAFTQASRFA